MDRTTLGNRMKRYEKVWNFKLTPRMPMIVRVDGKAFHTFTREMKKPFDSSMTIGMGAVATGLCENLQGAKLAFFQSDEVSVLLTDYETFLTEPCLGGRLQRITSVAASIATVRFNTALRGTHKLLPHNSPIFDARVFTLPKEEVSNYFLWRQQDTKRNAIQMIASSRFSHAELQGKSTPTMIRMLQNKYGVFLDRYPKINRFGGLVSRGILGTWVTQSCPEILSHRNVIEDLV